MPNSEHRAPLILVTNRSNSHSLSSLEMPPSPLLHSMNVVCFWKPEKWAQCEEHMLIAPVHLRYVSYISNVCFCQLKRNKPHPVLRVLRGIGQCLATISKTLRREGLLERLGASIDFHRSQLRCVWSVAAVLVLPSGVLAFLPLQPLAFRSR